MDLSIHIHDFSDASRLFFSRSLTKEDLSNYVSSHQNELYGAGIRVYTPFWGPLFAIIGLAQKWITNQGVFYLNTSSLKKYFYRLFVIHPSHKSLQERVQLIGEHMMLPISPLSVYADTRSKFVVKAKGIMKTLHVYYTSMATSGYSSSILNQINVNYLLSALGKA